MKDIILITAYCPDTNRLDKLRKLVVQLQRFKEKYDIMVVSHTTVPTDIQDKVDLCLYDKKNELLTEWDLINQPWFSPNGDGKIQSGLLTGRNTHLAIWRMMILSFSMCKNIGYEKIHHIEYDCEIVDDKEISDNSIILDSYDSVYYLDVKKRVSDILFGSFQSYKIKSLPEPLVNLDEKWIKELIRSSPCKSPERMLKKLLISSGRSYEKDRSLLEIGGNKFATSENDEGFNDWGVPFVDLLDECVYFIVWNTRKESVENTIVYNDSKILKTGKVLKGHWKLLKIDNINNLTKIVTLENDIVRDVINFKNNDDRELFKKISYRER